MTGSDDAAWRESVEEERAWRDEHYTDADTPLSKEAREKFTGLKWFPPNAAFRLEGVTLERHTVPKAASLGSTGEEGVVMVEVGVLRFELDGTACELTAFEPAPGETDEPYVFVPFRDKTSGKETYGGGRYLDFEPRDDDTYEVDFNRAYHPYCVFDEAWSCILPPPQNQIPVRVEAGERLP